MWEVLEPLIQNCIDHAGIDKVNIDISTKYDEAKNLTTITIEDNGKGFAEDLLKADSEGFKKIFSEYVSTKNYKDQNSGYGCYIAYQIAVKRCGWKLDAVNKESNGAMFVIQIQN